jgi:hypothetical protein
MPNESVNIQALTAEAVGHFNEGRLTDAAADAEQIVGADPQNLYCNYILA